MQPAEDSENRDGLTLVGLRLRERRRASHKTAQEVAFTAGITQTYLSMLENPKPGKKSRPSADVLARIAKTLDFSSAQLRELLTLAGHGVLLDGTQQDDHDRDDARITAEPPASATADLSYPTASIPFDQWMLIPPEPLNGRRNELEWLLDRLTGAGLRSVAALHGMPGIGKTALAAAAVHRVATNEFFPDGVAVVLCQGLSEPGEVLRRVIERFGAHFEISDREASDWALDLPSHVYRLLHGKRALVVLDDVEGSLQIKQVIPALRSAGVALLVTSREIVSREVIPAEASRTLALLEPPDALALFARCLGYRRISDLSEDDIASAKRIVTALGYHTLAIKLAGTYAADVGRDLSALAHEVEDTPSALDLPGGEPQRLASFLAGSIKSLDPPVQKLFQALSLFVPDVGRKAALHLAQHFGLTETALALLVRRALLVPSTRDSMPLEGDRERLHMHKLLRAFAATRLDGESAASANDVRRVAATYYARYVEDLWSVQQSDRRHAILEADETNIVNALTWACTAWEHKSVVQLSSGLRHYWRDRWLTQESQIYLPVAIESARGIANKTDLPQDHLAWARLELSYAHVLRRTGQLEHAHAILDDTLARSRAVLLRDCEAAALYELGQVARQQGSLSQAAAYFDDCVRIRETLGDLRGEGAALGYLARIALQRSDLTAAREYCERSLALARHTLDSSGEAAVLFRLGQLALTAGQLAEANERFGRSLELYQNLQDGGGKAASLSQLGRVALERARLCADMDERRCLLDEAQSLTQYAHSLERALGNVWGRTVNLAQLGRIVLERGDLDAAHHLFSDALRQAETTKDQWHIGVLQAQLGRVALERARPCADAQERSRLLDEAEKHYRTAVDLAEGIPNLRGKGVDLTQLGQIAWARGNLAEAEAAFRAGLRIIDEVNDVVNFVDQALAFGAFLIQRQIALEEDRIMLVKAAKLCAEIAPHRQQEAREMARQIGRISRSAQSSLPSPVAAKAAR